MRICLLTTQDLDADQFPDDDWPCDPRPFLPEHDWHVAVLEGKSQSVTEVEVLIENGYDLFFNLCDGAEDQDVPGIEIIQTLEKSRVPFVGAVSTCYEPTRLRMKEVCRELDISTPECILATCMDQVEIAAKTLQFPLFVKHPSSYASVDLSRRSRVQTPAGLRIQAKKMLTRHGGALIEQYIDGIECTVLIAENPEDPSQPTAYTPVQYRFPNGEYFKHADLKWVEYDALKSFPVPDTELAERLKNEAARFFVALGAASFARCDFRVDSTGTPYMLEINPNCGVFYPPTDPGSADICLLHDPAGHQGFAQQLVRSAISRHHRSQEHDRSVR